MLASTGLSVEATLINHWKTFGRNYHARYDYENCLSQPSNLLMEELEKKIYDPRMKGAQFIFGSKTYIFKHGDNFEYCDPIDHSISTKQVKIEYFITYIVLKINMYVFFKNMHRV